MAVGVVALTGLMVSTSLAWSARLAPPGTFSAIPDYWHEAADWLTAHQDGRVLVVPGAPFATQVWGTSHDEPLQVLGSSAWGVRDSIPLTPPQTIRALDSVQRLFAAGRPSAGLADSLTRQGISYVVVRNDLDPESSRSARPILVHRAIAGSPGLTKVAEFGAPVGPGLLAGFVNDSGLRPRYPAVQIYRVGSGGNPGAPYFADAGRLLRVDGGPEVLLRLDERRRLLGQPALGPVLMTSDAQVARLPTPAVTVTDTPLARETDYGRVDLHSSAIRAPGDSRHTYNRVPDYPAPGADTVYGSWTGGRITVSSSSSDATALPDVAAATSPAAAVDGDPATAWVSNALQSAVGQWLQVDFDHPVTNAVLTLTPSASAVGAQVRRILVETANGSTTLRFDESGKPLNAALPVGETPWVRVTAAGTDDGSPGVQFGITDLTVTQYDASGFAHPVQLRHTVLVPGPPADAMIASWDLGAELLGRPGCAPGPDNVRCAASMALAPEEPVNLSRTLTVPSPVSVTPTVWVRPRQGPKLADLIAEPDTTRAYGDSDLVEVLGSAYAATDGDPATAWTAPQRVVQYKTPPTLTLRLPRATEVTGLRLAPSRTTLPAHPTMVAVDLGDGPQVQAVDPGRDVADADTASARDRHRHGEPARLAGHHRSQRAGLRPAQAARACRGGGAGRRRQPDRGCPGWRGRPPPGDRRRLRARPGDRGGGPVHAYLDPDHGRRAVERRAGCGAALRTGPIALPAGRQELLISPGAAFVVDGAQLSAIPGPPSVPITSAAVETWGPARRKVRAPASGSARVLVIPESINPGWVARTSSGARLTPVAVNGWQQGWLIPAGDAGTITLTFASNTLYRAGLAAGLSLLPLLAVLAFWRRRSGSDDGPPAVPWATGPWVAVAVLGAGALIAGAAGVLVVGAAGLAALGAGPVA